jgi:hypothetical protein
MPGDGLNDQTQIALARPQGFLSPLPLTDVADEARKYAMTVVGTFPE